MKVKNLRFNFLGNREAITTSMQTECYVLLVENMLAGLQHHYLHWILLPELTIL